MLDNLILDIYITGKCNYKCPYCYGEDFNQPDISLEIFEHALEFSKKYNCKLSFTGGEPLLHNNFTQLIQKAKEQSIPMFLRTNGIFLNKYFIELNIFEWIGISLDGLENINNILRPNHKNYNFSSIEKFEIPIKAIMKINKQYPHIKVLLATIATGLNSAQLIKMANYLNEKELDIDKWKIYDFTRNNFRSLYASKLYDTSFEEFTKLKKQLKKTYVGNIVFKENEGNCIIIETNGDLRINSDIIGNIQENKEKLYIKVINSLKYCEILKNKAKTYNE